MHDLCCCRFLLRLRRRVLLMQHVLLLAARRCGRRRRRRRRRRGGSSVHWLLRCARRAVARWCIRSSIICERRWAWMGPRPRAVCPLAPME
uniref:Secreted protein n=1 Tax=Oryza brachyantha TaxID=4533 RepID=J3LTZ5_ORYBR